MIRILVVEDDEIIASGLKYALEMEKYMQMVRLLNLQRWNIDFYLYLQTIKAFYYKEHRF